MQEISDKLNAYVNDRYPAFSLPTAIRDGRFGEWLEGNIDSSHVSFLHSWFDDEQNARGVRGNFIRDGAPVLVGVQPTSSRMNDGGTKSMICQRSTLPVKPPILTNDGGAGWSMIQRSAACAAVAPAGAHAASSAAAGTPIS